MKKILLTGEKGRFVRLFLNFVEEREDDSCVETISVRGTAWKQIDFGKYDAVVHCAGMIGNKDSIYEEYYKINVELTRDVYNHCRSSGVKQFIYLSSMAVYDGIGWGFGKDGIIVEDTKPKQISYYGKSKYEAERILQNEDSEMKVAIIRAPSIVGKGMENYFESYKVLTSLPFIPSMHLEAKRSYIYIDSLILFILNIIHGCKSGIFFPQNYPLLSVTEIVEEINKCWNKKKIRVRVPNWLLPSKVEKDFFQQICYSESLSKEENLEISEISSIEAIRRTIVNDGRKGK